eukprot:668486-Pyramimonas_sp.AAC.1
MPSTAGRSARRPGSSHKASRARGPPLRVPHRPPPGKQPARARPERREGARTQREYGARAVQVEP